MIVIPHCVECNRSAYSKGTPFVQRCKHNHAHQEAFGKCKDRRVYCGVECANAHNPLMSKRSLAIIAGHADQWYAKNRGL